MSIDESISPEVVSDPETAALAVDDLHLSYIVRGTPREVLRGVSFEVRPGEAYGLVGESGCGKSTTAYAALRYLPSNGRIDSGHVTSSGQELTAMSARELREFRANKASMVFQDPVQAVNPVLKIGRQVAESFEVMGQSKDEARASALKALERVHIASPESVMERYPHQLSGGMLQRVVIAMALACDPTLLVLDEPTTGLDATVEAEVLDLVRELRSELNSAILLIAHNLGVIRTMCDRVGVMYAGRVVEEGTVDEVFDNPSHPYTVGLLNSIPRHGLRKDERELFAIPGNLPQIGESLPTCVYVDRCPIATDVCRTEVPPIVDRGDQHWTRCHHPDRISDLPEPDEISTPVEVGTEEVIGVHGVSKTFRQRGHEVPALVSVDLGFAEGETLGLVGESGSGKSTLAKTMLGVHEPDEGGAITLRGRKMKGKATDRIEESIRSIQMVFQNPNDTLNPSHTIGGQIMRVIRKFGVETDKEKARELMLKLLDTVKLPRDFALRKPRQLSGGQKQRIGIARAFAGNPSVVIADEPVSALDVSVAAAVTELLMDIQREHGTTLLFISHDLSVVRYLADRVVVMYLGNIVEVADRDTLFRSPKHPYTQALLNAVPEPDPLVEAGKPENLIIGEVPSVRNPPAGCRFHPRCPQALARCRADAPSLQPSSATAVACHLYRD